MEIQTGWVKPPKQIGGLDHLGVQAPCINLYGKMLPGITNVTDRARYYSFYPWVVWALERRGFTKFNDTFVDRYRKADCLFTLIASRHAYVVGNDRDEHAAATIGSANLSKQISKVCEGESVRLSEFAHRQKERHQYFKNKLGGLGQYYLGVFSDLNIMDGTVGSGIKYTNQIGKVLAQAMDETVEGSLFLDTIEADKVSPDRLDELACFCPCQLTTSQEEHKLLCDLFFVKSLFAEMDMLPRRRTLQVLLYLSDDLAQEGFSIDLHLFRGCVYSNSLPSGRRLQLPERLQINRQKWSIYQRNELLSIAVQGLFYALLDTYEESGQRFQSARSICQWFTTTSEIKEATKAMGLKTPFRNLDKGCRSWLPELSHWTHKDHEIHLSTRVEELCRKEKNGANRSEIIQDCLKILLALKNRIETGKTYEEFMFPPNYFHFYPINLKTFVCFSQKDWMNLTAREWIEWLCYEWGLKAHFRIALRKLRNQSQSTFRIRPSDRESDQGLEVIEAPRAVFTSPRFNQALRILKDISALVKRGGRWVTSDLGHNLKEFTDG